MLHSHNREAPKTGEFEIDFRANGIIVNNSETIDIPRVSLIREHYILRGIITPQFFSPSFRRVLLDLSCGTLEIPFPVRG